MDTVEIPDIEMMADPDKWPHIHVLPMVKRGGQDMPECAFLYAPTKGFKNVNPILYIGNIYDPKPVKAYKQKAYPSLRAILDDGWEVD